MSATVTLGTENRAMDAGVHALLPVELLETDEEPTATAPDHDDEDDFDDDDEDALVIRDDDEGDE